MSPPTRQVSHASAKSSLWLEQHSTLQPHARRALAELAPDLLEKLPQDRFTSLAIAGPPGSGKSTLARLLSFLLNDCGRPTVMLSLDDYYLGRLQRQSLARSCHPLLQQRGVPGTHDWQSLLRVADALRTGHAVGLRLPIFDKSTDDPAPSDCWPLVDFNPSCLIIEGWCLGVPAQDSALLAEPVNDLERLQDPDCSWRTWVNDQLAGYHTGLVGRIDRCWYLDAPAWDDVIDWRWQQEQELAQPRMHGRTEVAAFLATFERIVKHMQTTAATWADLRLQADQSHCLRVME